MTVDAAPRIPAGALVRKRLLDVLDEPVPLHLVRAPAGGGKTVLLAQWATGTTAEGLWVAVENSLWRAGDVVSAVIERLEPPGRGGSGGTARLEAGEDPWRVLRSALARAGREFVCVLDDADRLSDETLQELARELPRLPGLRVVASARRPTPLSEAGVALAMDVLTLDAADLAFTTAEVAEYLGVPADRAARLAEDTGGLPLAVRAIRLARDSGAIGAAERGAATSDEVAAAMESYFSQRSAARAGGVEAPARDEDSARFLVRTAAADVLTPGLAAELAGVDEDEAERLLAAAEADGLGLWTDEGGGRVFTYTTVFRELLRRRLEQLPESERRRLAFAVARWSMAHGRAAVALSIAVRERDLDFATAVAKSSWDAIVSGRMGRIDELLSPLGLRTLRAYPVLAMLLALRLNSSGTQRLRAVELFLLVTVGSRAARAGASPDDRALLRSMEAVAFRLIGRFSSALAAAQDARDGLNGLTVDESGRLGILLPVLYRHIGVTFLYANRYEEGLDCFERSAALADSIPGASALAARANIAGLLALSGEMRRARVAADRARDADWPEGWLTGYTGSLYQVARAFDALERFDADEAQRRVDVLAEHRETIEHWPLLVHIEAMALLLRGSPEAALAAVDDALRDGRRRRALAPLTLARLQATRSLLLLASGDAAAATRELATRGPAAVGALIPRARLALVEGDTEAVFRHLHRLRREGPLSARAEAEASVIELAALLRAGLDEQAAEAAPRVDAHLESTGLRTPLALLPEEDAARLREFGARMSSVSTALTADVPALLRPQRAAARLTPREMAVLEALVEGDPIPDIASRLVVSVNTVKSQLRSVYRKLGVAGRQEAVAAAVARGLFARDAGESPAPGD